MHRNPWWFTARGPTLDSGALVAGLEFATGRRALVTGKPSAAIFRVALAELRAEIGAPRLRAGDVAMVGDDIRADVLAAKRAGLRGVLVLTGKHGPSDLAEVRNRRGGGAPDAVAPSLADVVAALD
jgi:ribonucleotide monophosphatase NagD (HAD superfamily)